mmetsp:Transcript_54829/g.134118  ORF Transcript_54829/g.134118 Transcript_54829/m.134118 type:complete len:252 (-) Transcript_54829:384-1139(-)
MPHFDCVGETRGLHEHVVSALMNRLATARPEAPPWPYAEHLKLVLKERLSGSRRAGSTLTKLENLQLGCAERAGEVIHSNVHVPQLQLLEMQEGGAPSEHAVEIWQRRDGPVLGFERPVQHLEDPDVRDCSEKLLEKEGESLRADRLPRSPPGSDAPDLDFLQAVHGLENHSRIRTEVGVPERVRCSEEGVRVQRSHRELLQLGQLVPQGRECPPWHAAAPTKVHLLQQRDAASRLEKHHAKFIPQILCHE